MEVLRFTAKWCGPCKATGPIVAKEAELCKLGLRVIDIEEEPEVAMHYRVLSVPTVVVVDEDGAEVARLVGGFPPMKYRNAFRQMMSPSH